MRLFIILLCIGLSIFWNVLSAQVTISVDIDSGSSTTTCTDGFFGGSPDPHWRVNIENQGWTTYPRTGVCFTNPPNTQYAETFNCPSQLPTSLGVCLRAFEDDGGACIVSESCSVDACQNFALPAVGSSVTYSLNVSGASSATVNFTIQVTGSFPPGYANDQICDAIDLGILNANSTLGNSALSNYANFCATNTGDPSAWGGNNDQGVWFKFETGSTVSSIIDIAALSDPQNFGNGIDLQLALYESSNGLCNGTLTLVQEDYQGGGVLWDEDMNINCLKQNTVYFLLLDGESSLLMNGGQEGFFGLEISAGAIVDSGDEICDAEDLGQVPEGGSIGTPNLSRSNICATSLNDPTPDSWSPNQSVWFMFQAPPSGHVLVDAKSDLFFPLGVDAIDLQLALYGTSTDVCTGNLIPIVSAYTPNLFDESLEASCLVPGDNYWLMVDGSSLNSDGIFDVTITDGGAIVATNNLICEAVDMGDIQISSANLTNQSNYCADNLFDPIPSTWTNDHGVWYSFTAPLSGKVAISATNVNALDPAISMDLELALYRSSANDCSSSLTEIISSYNVSDVSLDESMTVSCLVPGQTYWLLVDGASDILFPNRDVGLFNLSITNVDPLFGSGTVGDMQPVNDYCFGAIDLSIQTSSCTQGFGSFETYNYSSATIDNYDPSLDLLCGEDCGDTWYKLTIPTTGSILIEGKDTNVNGDNSILNVAVYTGSCSMLSYVACYKGGLANDISFTLDASTYGGQTIWLKVYSENNADENKDFQLCASQEEFCGADTCHVALDRYMESTVSYCFNTNYATGEDIAGGDAGYNECTEGDSPERSLYYYFRSEPGTSYVTVSLNDITIGGSCILGTTPSDGFNMSIYKDDTPCDNSPEALIDCQTFTSCDVQPINSSFVYTNLAPNSTYVIQLDGGFNTLGGDNVGRIMVTGNLTILPSELIDFTSTQVDDDVVLTWTIAAGANIDHYIVEYSIDGNTFETVDIVYAASELGEKTTYHLTDYMPANGVVYYRLTEVDSYGGSTVVGHVSQAVKRKAVALNIYPNPSNRSLFIQLQNYEDEAAQLLIYNNSGVLVYAEEVMLYYGENKLPLSLIGFAEGMYHVELKRTKDVLNQKFIKAR